MSLADETAHGSDLYADVALPLPPRRTFTYRLPAELADNAAYGSRVIVPFGNRKLTGYIVALSREWAPSQELDPKKLRNIGEVLDDRPLITDEIFELTRWTAQYYAASWGELLKAALPAGINAVVERSYAITSTGRDWLLNAINSKPRDVQLLRRLDEHGPASRVTLEEEFGKDRLPRLLNALEAKQLIAVHEAKSGTNVKPKLRKAVRLANKVNADDEKALSGVQLAVVATLQAAGGEMDFAGLIETAGVSGSVVGTLQKRGYVDVFIREVRRDPFGDGERAQPQKLTLTVDQSEAFSQIENAIVTGKYHGFLLYGVTGSGKTEVYIRAMRESLRRGRSALMLVPEIALTPVFSRRLRAAFGDDVAILHSKLSKGERYDEWRRLRSGDARVAIGTRSAVFAPLADLGLVIVDEEHDSSYRQSESPFYNARDVAVMRANMANAVVVLGSATPALETYHNTHTGKYTYLRMPNRIEGRPLAEAELVDMRDVFKASGKDVLLSPRLIEAIRETHERGEQSIILLNRRGFSAFVLCRSCGESLRCRNCDITLTYHKRDAKIACHYCGYSVPTPKECPFCESEFLYFIGDGTEKLEQSLAKVFPALRIARIDRDTMNRKGQMAKTLFAFDRGEIDMLAGTQMIAKGHDFHNVTLVGVISVDTGLGLPDFRSAERTFQLLTQVAGRAGRGTKPGKVIIQTYYPEHYALQHAVEQDYAGFADDEMAYRRRMSYPPFVVLASILIKHSNEMTALKNAEILKAGLAAANSDKKCLLLGPAPASLARLKGEYRFQILIKSEGRKTLRKTLETGLDTAEETGCDMRCVSAEIDPINLM
jgi:primosomal protein N' (replication factor Y)